MGTNIQVPVDLKDEVALKRFLQQLTSTIVQNINSNDTLTDEQIKIIEDKIVSNTQVAQEFLNLVSKIDTLRTDIRTYVEKNLETVILQTQDDIALVAEQFGTFYAQATAAAWYGLTVKAGNIISGFTVGSLDTDTTTPGTGGSFFAINADSFTVGKAYEDITDPAELAYLQANNLPYGTIYNAATQEIIPAFAIDWNGSSYDIFFNGKVSFTNIDQYGNILTNSTVIDGDQIATGSIDASKIDVTNLVVKYVSDGSANPAFEISVDGDAGPNQDANIYGSVIRGSNIIGSSIIGSSITLLNAYNKYCFPMFSTIADVSGGVINYNFYGMNSSSYSNRRIYNATSIVSVQGVIWELGNGNLDNGGSTNSVTITLKAGSTTLTSGTYYNNNDKTIIVTLAGMKFEVLIENVGTGASVYHKRVTAMPGYCTTTNSASGTIQAIVTSGDALPVNSVVGSYGVTIDNQ
jgi:hypothetical protein